MRRLPDPSARIRGRLAGTWGTSRSTDPEETTMSAHDDATTGPTTDPQGDPQTHLDTDPVNQPDSGPDDDSTDDPASDA
jgi:hypothetical protein